MHGRVLGSGGAAELPPRRGAERNVRGAAAAHAPKAMTHTDAMSLREGVSSRATNSATMVMTGVNA